MPSLSPVAPLAAIDALVLDCEATGLDARSARIVQVGAIALSGGRLDRTVVLDQLVNPGTAIPPATVAVHGITDARVAGEPAFAAVAPRLSVLLEGRLLIGHSLAYDLALLAREHQLAGLAWSPPRALDVRTLARVAAPGLADHGLDRLCDWLSVVNEKRHSALGDAVATAEVFLALVPLLRQRGIRTLGEAEQACRRIAEADARSSGGLLAVAEPGAEPAAGATGLDVFAYRHRVRDVMTAPAAIVDGGTTVAEAMAQLLDKGSSSVFVDLGEGLTGIVTERDVLRAVHAGGPEGLWRPVRDIAKRPLQSVDEDDHVYRAIGRMERMRFRHLGVRDRTGRVVGALTPRNLLRNRATAAIAIGDAIAAADRPAELAATWAEVPGMIAALLRDEVEARTAAGVISAEICAITRRSAELAEAELVSAGHGSAPCRYAVLVLGSAGRGESLLAADQDNAIVFEAGEPGGPADIWFERMAVRMCEVLDQAGIVYCKGGVMAKTPEWRHSRDGWEELIARWVHRQRPQDLLNVDIFFDATTVAGDRALGDELLGRACALAGRTRDFLMMLTELARQWSPPLRLFGGFAKEDGRVDLKKGGLLPIFTAARVLALKHGIDERSTAGRLRELVARGVAGGEQIERILDAQECLMRAILDQQLEDGRTGIRLSPRVDPGRLDKAGQRRLREAIGTIGEVIDIVSEGRI